MIGAPCRGPGLTWAGCGQVGEVNPEGELADGDRNEGSSDQPTSSGHGMYPVGSYEYTPSPRALSHMDSLSP